MKVLLIGADGQFGSDLVLSCPKQVELIKSTVADLDITNEIAVKEKINQLKPDVVINTAAYVNVDKAEEDAELATKINATAVKNIASVCQNVGAKLVQISTDFVFTGHDDKAGYNEKDVPSPDCVYGISKYAGELYAKSYCDKTYIVRVAFLYGKAGSGGKGGNIVYSIIRKAKAGEELKMINDITISPTHTLDASKAIWQLLASDNPYGIYHFANSGNCTLFDFAKEILKIAKLETKLTAIPASEYPFIAKRPVRSDLINTSNIKLPSWQGGLKEFVEEIDN